MDRVDEILKYWFGHVEQTIIPSPHRNEVWFGGKKEFDDEIKAQFEQDVKNAIEGKYQAWEEDPRGTLALIILLDQFPRHIYRGLPQAYAQEQKALDLCLQGVQKEYDHALSLMERVFFYFPLMHSENLEMQATSVRAFQILVNLAFPETRGIFEDFLNHALMHYDVIKRFGRFPQRNMILGRPYTSEEQEFLKNGNPGQGLI